jgi:hypothetical protein
MDVKKFEKLIDLVINEDTAKAKALFHDIVIEQSRQIYESLMEEDEDEMGGQIGDLMDEIDSEESGVDDEDDFNGEGDYDDMASDEDEVYNFDADDEDDAPEEVEDAVIRIEDKIDQLMADFEAMMGDDSEDDESEEMPTDEDETEEDENDDVMESVEMKTVKVTHGDNGSNVKSPVLANSGKAGMSAKPVSFSSSIEKGRTAPSVKDVDGSNDYRNRPGLAKQKLENVAKPKQEDGSNTKSPVAESRKRQAMRRTR